MSKCCWKNGASRLAQHRVAANLQFVKQKQNQTNKKNAVSVKHNKAKCNKTRYACTYDENSFSLFIEEVESPKIL